MAARPLYVATCEVHGKLLFDSRKDARLHARRIHPGDSRMNAYPCDATPGMWHLGHLPGPVVGGHRRRATIYNNRIAPSD